MGVGKREQLARALDRTGVLGALLRVRRRTPGLWLPVLTYHRISEPSAETRFDRGVIDATPEQFDRQLQILGEFFTVVDQEQLIAHFARGARLPKNAVAITFDDGYRDCLDVALPILRRHNVTATFFIATSYTSERRVYWWDRLAYALSHATAAPGTAHINFPEPLPIDLTRPGDTLAHLIKLAKTWRGLDLPRFLDAVCEACGVEWSRDIETRLSGELVMTWDDVRALRDAGMDVQSHTRTHRVLGTLLDDELDDELGGSREELEGQLGQPVKAIAYPVGHSIANDPKLVSAVARAGYDIGFTNASGVNPRYRDVHRYDVSRDAMDIEMSGAMFRGMLAIPYLSRVRGS